MKYLTTILLFISLTCSAQIPKDKQDHIAVGSLIGFSSTVLTIDKPALNSLAWSVGAATVIGGAKELYDINHGTAEWADLGATVIGSVIGWGVLTIFEQAATHHHNKRYKGMVYGSTYIGNLPYDRSIPFHSTDELDNKFK